MIFCHLNKIHGKKQQNGKKETWFTWDNLLLDDAWFTCEVMGGICDVLVRSFICVWLYFWDLSDLRFIYLWVYLLEYLRFIYLSGLRLIYLSYLSTWKTWEIYLWFTHLKLLIWFTWIILEFALLLCDWLTWDLWLSMVWTNYKGFTTSFVYELFQLLTIFADLKVPKCKVPFFVCVFHCHGAFGSSLCRDFRQISNREG